MQLLYKICALADWTEAEAAGVFTGSAVDQVDGFIHLSAAYQVGETARRHFSGVENLVLVAFVGESLQGLRWEPSRNGALFPHVYGAISAHAALWVRPMPLTHGVHVFPDGIPQ